MKKLLLAFTTLSMLLLSSCDKDDDDDDNVEPSLTVESLAGNYRLMKVLGKTNIIPETEITNDYLEPCERDDIITLNANSTYDYKDEGTECSPPGDTTGAWALTNDKIIIGLLEFTVTKWDGRELHGTTTETIEISPGVTQEATITFQFTRL